MMTRTNIRLHGRLKEYFVRMRYYSKMAKQKDSKVLLFGQIDLNEPKCVLWQTVKTRMKCCIMQGLSCFLRQKCSSEKEKNIGKL